MNTEQSLAFIRRSVLKLYKTHPQIHINVSIVHPKIKLFNVEAVITGVYPHIFTIKEETKGVVYYRSLTYADLITGRIEILELMNRTQSPQ